MVWDYTQKKDAFLALMAVNNWLSTLKSISISWHVNSKHNRIDEAEHTQLQAIITKLSSFHFQNINIVDI